MAVLNRDDFFARINKIIGTDSSDESISFVEDMTDTYNSLEKSANGDGVNWEEKYHELDNSWKKKYQNRFFSGSSTTFPQGDNPPEPPKETKIEDLFK